MTALQYLNEIHFVLLFQPKFSNLTFFSRIFQNNLPSFLSGFTAVVSRPPPGASFSLCDLRLFVIKRICLSFSTDLTAALFFRSATKINMCFSN